MGFNKLGAVKWIASGVVGMGVGKIVGGIIKNHVTIEKSIDKVTVLAATWAITGVVTERTKKYTDESIDKAVETAQEVVQKIKDKAIDGKLERINSGKSTFDAEDLEEKDFVKDEHDNWKRPSKDSEVVTAKLFTVGSPEEIGKYGVKAPGAGKVQIVKDVNTEKKS